MKKKLAVLFFLIVCSQIYYSVFAFEERNTSVITDSGIVIADINTIIQDEDILIPVRPFFEGIGASVMWDETSKTVNIVKDGTIVDITIANEVIKNNNGTSFKCNMMICNSRIFVPLKAISEVLNISAEYNDEESIIELTGKTEVDILEVMSDDEKCWMGITNQQYVEDFDYLYEQLNENYPYTSLVERSLGFDIFNEYQTYREKIKTCKNDVEFYSTVKDFINKFEFMGHIELWGYRYISEVQSMKAVIDSYPQYKEQLTPYIDKLDNSISKNNYKSMQQFYEKVSAAVNEANINMPDIDNNFYYEIEQTPNVQTNVIEENNIAYVKINSFDLSFYDEDKETLYKFFSEVEDYPNLIIDITDNGGGSMDYFNDLIAAPLISKEITVPTYMFVKGGSNNSFYLQLDKGLKNGEWKGIDELSYIDGLNYDDIAQMDYFKVENYTLKPSENNLDYKGKIWLLVSKNNYSSSEYAAMISKSSGFATLVGEQTSGDGIGVDPVYIIMPNSGLVIQYSPIYGVAPDGTCSEEYGTMPDIISPTDESEIDTCIKAIKKQL